MRSYEADQTLTAWSNSKTDSPYQIDSPWQTVSEKEARTGENAVLARFMGARILARPDLLADGGRGVSLTSYSQFVRKDGKPGEGSDFQVPGIAVQTITIKRIGTTLRGCFSPDNLAGLEQSEGFNMCRLRSLPEPTAPVGQEGFGVGIREGYFLGAEIHFDDGIVNPAWVFGPVYRFPDFPEAQAGQVGV